MTERPAHRDDGIPCDCIYCARDEERRHNTDDWRSNSEEVTLPPDGWTENVQSDCEVTP